MPAPRDWRLRVLPTRRCFQASGTKRVLSTRVLLSWLRDHASQYGHHQCLPVRSVSLFNMYRALDLMVCNPNILHTVTCHSSCTTHAQACLVRQTSPSCPSSAVSGRSVGEKLRSSVLTCCACVHSCSLSPACTALVRQSRPLAPASCVVCLR